MLQPNSVPRLSISYESLFVQCLIFHSNSQGDLLKKVLFIASHRKDRAPGQRFRFEQYMDFLNAHGYDCHLSSLLTVKEDKLFYSRGKVLRKANILRRSSAKRRKDLKHANDYDIIFIFREALMTRSTYFEKHFSRSSAKVIYDFDDAIWMNDTSDANRLFKWMKNPAKISKSIGYADLVFAGNAYLADYARKFNSNVEIVPTTIDTDEYRREPKTVKGDKIVIGWSGSLTTIKHFQLAVPFLLKIKEKYGDRVQFKVIGDSNYRNEDLGIKGNAWNRKTEVHDLSEIDIGIMPLPQDKWAKGKCGLKGLQYMALEIPTIMSPVGVNTEIIREGVNGFLAARDFEWITKLSSLIDDAELRRRIGAEARKTVVEKYSVMANRHLYLQHFEKLAR